MEEADFDIQYEGNYEAVNEKFGHSAKYYVDIFYIGNNKAVNDACNDFHVENKGYYAYMGMLQTLANVKSSNKYIFDILKDCKINIHVSENFNEMSVEVIKPDGECSQITNNDVIEYGNEAANVNFTKKSFQM